MKEKWKTAILAVILMAAVIAVMLIVSWRVNAVYGTDFEAKGENIMVMEPETAGLAPAEHEGEEPALIYTAREAEMIAKTLWGECRGIKSKMEQAAVAWCILNRVDDPRFGDTIESVIRAPYQFAGFRESNPVSTPLLDLAKDVLERWLTEKSGCGSVGRVLPKEYCYFWGNGIKNFFFNRHTGELPRDCYEFDCADPYAEKE